MAEHPTELHPTASRLVEVATALVDEQGEDALTVRAVVDESGISMGSLYHHFGSLDELRQAVVSRALGSWSDAFLRGLARGGLAAAYGADRTWTRRHSGVGSLIESTGRRGELGAAADRFGAGLRAWLDERGLAVGVAPQLVAAVVLGPAIELRRLERATSRGAAADLDALAVAVEAALRALPQLKRSRASSLRCP